MIDKKELLECSITKFLKFGSKAFTLDELSKDLGISKKSIYKYFNTKEDLVTEGIIYLIEKYSDEVEERILDIEDPIKKIIVTYKIGFEYLKLFKPSFLFGLKKYYHNADNFFENFRIEVVKKSILPLLEEAQIKQYLRKDLNLNLMCDLYFYKISDYLFNPINLFDKYESHEILDHLIINNLRGFLTDKYFENHHLPV
ncbi:TetR/AcrR family transcriptional regulator [Urechidicola croceus]|uniref:HTH tetR-type domain-containing protein n=1 Tax=Urechidicola croceus TaxID=1850246 RepID=A0A1D8P965_9FLAO|nr:TetR/AcrR family transcriptional regulator [Urechidicola croceus]AOW21089.1 hypothetical protein LPB138_10545 [Urechidicola croceus]